jgi:hypothetical protein
MAAIAQLRSSLGHTCRTDELLSGLTKAGIARRTGERALARLKKAGRVTCPRVGIYQIIGAEGQMEDRQPPSPHIESCGGGDAAPVSTLPGKDMAPAKAAALVDYRA